MTGIKDNLRTNDVVKPGILGILNRHDANNFACPGVYAHATAMHLCGESGAQNGDAKMEVLYHLRNMLGNKWEIYGNICVVCPQHIQ